jgi:hypothetical protein
MAAKNLQPMARAHLEGLQVRSAKSLTRVLSFRGQTTREASTAIIDPSTGKGDVPPTIVVTLPVNNHDVARCLATIVIK